MLFLNIKCYTRRYMLLKIIQLFTTHFLLVCLTAIMGDSNIEIVGIQLTKLFQARPKSQKLLTKLMKTRAIFVSKKF